LTKPANRGRKPNVDLREVLNAIRYMTRSGGGWRMLPKDFPPWQTVYWWVRRFVRLMLFRTIHDIALSNSTPLTDVRPPSASAISRIAAAVCRCSIARSTG
jgi:transposase